MHQSNSMVPVAFRLPRSLTLRLQAEAAERGLTVSALIRRIIRDLPHRGLGGEVGEGTTSEQVL